MGDIPHMLHHHLDRHRHAIVASIPIMFLLASSLSLTRDPEEVCLVPRENRYVAVGEQVTLNVLANADEPINVIGGVVHVPPDYLRIVSLSREASIVDLWSEEPAVLGGSDVHFSGGVVSPTGFTGSGVVLTIVVEPTMPGEATIDLPEAHLLAHDGTGREVSCDRGPLILSIRPAALPSPDVNGDRHINILDVGILSARLFMRYQSSYDLNQDGTVNLTDIRILIAELRAGGILSSLALLAAS